MQGLPSKIICVGKNYAAHAAEMGGEVPLAPLLFFKPPSAIIAEGEAIVVPRASANVEYEGEIGVIVGSKLRRATVGEARSSIANIVAVNDVTARDLQRIDGQWARAKGFDTFCPIGNRGPVPGDLESMVLVTRVNGVEKQRARASEMVFGIPELLSYASQVMTIYPGDLMITGTPSGIGPLAPGDTVEIEIVGVSRVRSPVVAEAA